MQAEAEATNAIEKVVMDWVDTVEEDLKTACTDVSANAVVERTAQALTKAFATVANTVSTNPTR